VRPVRLALFLIALPASCKDGTNPPNSLPPASSGTLKPLTETFDLALGKAKVYRMSLPHGGRIFLDLRVRQGPVVDIKCLDEQGFLQISTGNHVQGFRALSISGTTSWCAEATVPPGTWFLMIKVAGSWGTSPALVVDAGTGTTIPDIGTLRSPEELAQPGQDGRISRVQATLEFLDGPQPASPPSIPLSASLDVAGDQEQIHQFTAPAGSTPGRLTGTWISSGQSRGIPGTSDDTLAAFELRGTDSYPLQRSSFSMTGAFDVWIEAPGTITFVFSNKGFTKSGSRRVALKGAYQPK
jgi:hypothetical protein